MNSLKGSQTEKNLLIAFAGESQARNRYTYFASQAKKEGLIQIFNAFEETASHEKEHAKRIFKFLEGGDVEITAAYPAGKIGTTAENLKASAAGENHEWTAMYQNFADIADKEGYMEVAVVLRNIAMAEKFHETRFLGFLKNIEEGKVFKKDKPVKWKCNNCGMVHEGPEPPEKCPACAHPKDYFEVLAENW
ncbi:MAG: rubrerythrin family protein [Candidatus Thermoplasmatota archaeon]|nr:rubrerythrin family protein [Euryarchaeota archaeon]MBU4032406.1 rubrerythrin family protein [Candidatus Thermoplasmatota archaeon]MBU4071533.1 rubrerythrin family protein [Candidatus Thermoplasmatota archaeon]MBU4143680.1 rubrerythrin family protein [Candidatus Thermoplasmatota archaeon]MBU4591806.1 rubrerythrin family protein [Candidatus Thermoplasmatota archaeon]